MWSNLSPIEQQLFNASSCDSTIIKDAIVEPHKIVYYDKVLGQFIVVHNYETAVPVLIVVIVVLSCIFLGIILIDD